MSTETVVPPVPAPEVATYPDGSPIKKGALSAEFWDTEAKAIQIAQGRTKGARKACRVKAPDGTVRFATTTHPHYLEEYILCHELGWEVTELGKTPRAASAPVTASGILQALNTLPEAERATVLAQLEAMGIKS